MRDFLKIFVDELERRKTVNPRYSLRAFARHMDIDPSVLSKAFKYQEVTARMCVKMLRRAPAQLSLEEKRNYLKKVIYAQCDVLYDKLKHHV